MSVVQEIRYAIRQLLHARSFSVIAVLTLALGIAGNTMFFAAVNGMVFRPIRATRTDGLYAMTYIYTGKLSGSPTAAQFRRLEADRPPGIARLGAIAATFVPVVVSVPGRGERVYVEVVTSGYALALDLVPQAGRLFLPEDDVAGAPRVAIVGDRLWREWFKGDPNVSGARVAINAQPFTIVGVAPRGFRGLAGSSYGTADIWTTPSATIGLEKGATHPLVAFGYWTTFVRPEPGVDRAAVESAIHAVLTGQPQDPPPDRLVIRLYPAAAFAGTDKLTSTGLTILALSSLLLVAACANLANMLFARGTQRAGEVAVRLSLGASRLQIFRLFLLESGVVAVLAAGVGLALALGVTSALGAAFPSFRARNFRMFVDLSPDYRVFLYAFGAGAVAAGVVGVITAWRASAVEPSRALAISAAGTGATKRTGAVRLGLVAVQVTAAVLLLMGAGLFIRATEKDLNRRVLFDTTPLATARIDLRMHGYHPDGGRLFFDRALAAVRALPGVDQAAVADSFPVGDYAAPATVDFRAEREVKGTDGTIRRIEGAWRTLRGGSIGVSPGFLATIGIPLLRGRDVGPTDQDTTTPVAIVNETAAHLLWPDQEALGKRLMFGSDGIWRTVVGVCGDPIEVTSPSTLNTSANLVLIPAAQDYRPERLIVIRSRRPAAQLEPLRGVIRAIDENVAVFDLATADSSIMAWAAPLRAAALLTGSLGLLALTIATLGVYGVIAYVVSLRTREFGIRMALGARSGQVLKMVLDDAIHLVLVGLMAGVFVTAVAERYFQSQRVGFMPNEISTWVGVLALILIVAIVAALVPARRASRIDPNVALREL